ncbi:MAG: MarR family winged helix-turn-helix transcriptional regulator [Massilia sp.]
MTTTTDRAVSDFCLRLVRTQQLVQRRLDLALGEQHGLSFGDFNLLQALASAPDGALRRIDLAKRLGTTAYGVTQLLVPMEKVGLVRRHNETGNASLKQTSITAAGAQLLAHATVTAHETCSELLDPALLHQLAPLADAMGSIERAAA